MLPPFIRRLTPKQYALIGLGVLVFAGLTLLYRQLDVEALHQKAAGLNGLAVFAAMTILPLFAFPVSIVHVIAGVRFGTGWGIVWVAVSIVLQLLASYALVKMAPRFFGRHVEPLRKRLPEAAYAPLTQFTMLLPGAPYFAQNYVLPLVGVPLGTYLLWGVPIHVLRSIVGIVFGDMSDNLTPARLAGFGVYAVTITLTCAWAFRRLRQRVKKE